MYKFSMMFCIPLCILGHDNKFKSPLMSSSHDFHKQEIAKFDQEIEKIKPLINYEQEWNSFLKFYFSKKTDWIAKSKELQNQELYLKWMSVQPSPVSENLYAEVIVKLQKELEVSKRQWALECDYVLKREFLKRMRDEKKL